MTYLERVFCLPQLSLQTIWEGKHEDFVTIEIGKNFYHYEGRDECYERAMIVQDKATDNCFKLSAFYDPDDLTTPANFSRLRRVQQKVSIEWIEY